MRRVFLVLIRFYQRFLSPLKPPTCRFYPSCSHYSYQAIQKHGIWVGGWLAIKRILKCGPWNKGGYDPVP
jgi:putative membrane protein insertion efficiency factor